MSSRPESPLRDPITERARMERALRVAEANEWHSGAALLRRVLNAQIGDLLPAGRCDSQPALTGEGSPQAMPA
jgi:hypothetical protein